MRGTGEAKRVTAAPISLADREGQRLLASSHPAEGRGRESQATPCSVLPRSRRQASGIEAEGRNRLFVRVRFTKARPGRGRSQHCNVMFLVWSLGRGHWRRNVTCRTDNNGKPMRPSEHIRNMEISSRATFSQARLCPFACADAPGRAHPFYCRLLSGQSMFRRWRRLQARRGQFCVPRSRKDSPGDRIQVCRLA